MSEPPKKKRKGGQRQRILKCREERGESHGKPSLTSALGQYLVESWTLGSMSPQQVQRIANLAIQDYKNAAGSTTTNLRDLEKLARLGDFGAAANNVHRDLMAFVGDMTCVAATKAFILPFKDTESLQHILLPHEVFASLYRHYEKAWLKTMVGYEVSNLPAFWLGAQNHPCFEASPLQEEPSGWQKWCVPAPCMGMGSQWLG